MGSLWQDLKYGARMLARSPGFTLIAAITLALGIGANTAMFSAIDAVLLRPLPYEKPDRLVRFQQQQSWPDMQELAERNRTFEALGGYTKLNLDLTDRPEAERIVATAVTGNLFPLFGVPAALGRTFAAQEDQPGGEHLILLSHGFWQTYLGARRDVLGTRLSFGGTAYTVVGVMPPGFQLPQDEANAWVLLRVELWEAAQHRGLHFLRAFGRLAPGVTLEQARAEMDALSDRLAQLYPDENKDLRFVPIPLLEYTVRNVRSALFVLLGAVGFVLLIACANVANLFLTRAAARQREMAIRAALGAGRWRLIRQLLTESLLLALAGGATGLLLALWLIDVTATLAAGSVPRLESVRLDPAVLGFTLILSLLTALLFGVLPALQVSAPDLYGSLKEGGRSSASPRSRRFRGALVTLETALALVLLIGAGLLVRSFHQVTRVDPGFRPQGLLTANLHLGWKGPYREIPRRLEFLQQVLARAEALPGVDSAAAITDLPYGEGFIDHDFVIEGREPAELGTEPDAYYRGVSPNYFETVGLPLRRGRFFTEQDREDAPLVVLINETMARQFFPGEDPIGHRLRWARRQTLYWMTIVGVVADTRPYSLDEGDQPAVYVPYRQERDSFRTWMNLVVRTSLEPTSLAPALKRAVAEVDKNIPLADIRTMEVRMASSVAGRRFQLLLLGLFALLALVLAAVGIYGVVSNVTAQRTHEIGIRVALGARPADILRMVVGYGMALTLMGVVAGLAAAVALTRLLASLLFEVSATDPVTFVGIALLLTAVALLACWLPARRATRVHPMAALRYE